MNWYILKDKTPVKASMTEACEWLNIASNRIIKRTEIKELMVSTVFLGLDHNYGHGNPVLFETMIFGCDYTHYQERYFSFDEAMQGHMDACNHALKATEQPIELKNLLIDLNIETTQ